MDRARTNIETLTKCRAILRRLEEDIGEAVGESVRALEERFSGVDENYRKDLTVYIDYLKSLENALGAFVDENSKAMEDRVRNITAYNQTAYRKRNIL